MVRLPLALLILTSVGLTATPVTAQQPAESTRAQALRDYHGPDLQGKDGPLANVGLTLLVLYHELRAFQHQDEDGSFTPSLSSVHVSDGRVTIDAIANGSADALREDLEARGLKDASTTGRVVSGKFPLQKIPSLEDVASLRSLGPSQSQTRGLSSESISSPATFSSEPTRPKQNDVPEPRSGSTADASPAPSTQEPSGGVGIGVLLVLFTVAAGLFGVLVGRRW